MKGTRIIAALLAAAIVICTIIGTTAATAQEISDVSDAGGADPGGIRTTYIVTLYWDDHDNAYDTRPDEVTAILTANGGEFGWEELYLNADNGWESVKSGLPVYYVKGPRTGEILYGCEIPDLPEDYCMSIEQTGNWFKVTCSLKSIFLFGDVDGDDEVSVADATVIQRYDVGMTVTVFRKAAGDVNSDQNVDIFDTSVIQRYLVGYDCSSFNVGRRI